MCLIRSDLKLIGYCNYEVFAASNVLYTNAISKCIMLTLLFHITFLHYFCETKDDPNLVKVLHSKAVGNAIFFFLVHFEIKKFCLL